MILEQQTHQSGVSLQDDWKLNCIIIVEEIITANVAIAADVCELSESIRFQLEINLKAINY